MSSRQEELDLFLNLVILDVASERALWWLVEMPRQARLDAHGILHHVMVRGLERRPIFRDDVDRRDFCTRLEGLVAS